MRLDAVTNSLNSFPGIAKPGQDFPCLYGAVYVVVLSQRWSQSDEKGTDHFFGWKKGGSPLSSLFTRQEVPAS